MISFEHVGLRYGFSPEVLNDLSFSLSEGSFHFLTGPSGAGKTSLMRLMYLGHLPSRGVVRLFDENITHMSRERRMEFRQRIGTVFQDFRLLPHLSAYDNVALPLRISGIADHVIRKHVIELMEWVGLSDHINALPHTLSGGQQQRIAVARSVIAKPKLILADEPTGNLDDKIGARIFKLFEQLNKMGTTVVVASHNVNMMRDFSYPVMVLDHGSLRIEAPQEQNDDLFRKLQEAF
jgi:cell division transport system ATP-binding protein